MSKATETTNTNSAPDLAEQLNHATSLKDKQQFQAAIIALEEILSTNKTHSDALLNLIDITTTQGKAQETIAYLETYTKQYPEDLNKQKQLTELYIKTQQYESALEQCQILLKNHPTQQTAYHLITSLIDKLPTNKTLYALCEQGLTKFPQDPTLLYGFACLNRATKQFDKEMACIEYAIATKGITASTIHVAYHELALSANKAERFDQAHYYFGLSNNIYYINNQKQASDYQSFFPIAETYKKHIESVDKNKDKYVGKNVDNFLDPIFILSFSPHDLHLPSHILSSHPELIVMQDTNLIQQLINTTTSNNATNYLEILDTLTPEQENTLRAHYYELASKNNPANLPEKSQLVDVSYANCLHVEFISRLFPKAQFILIERDTPDAIFNAFTSKHLASIFTLHCKNLGSAAQFYKTWQSFMESCITHLGLNILRINYRNYEQSIRNLTGKILHTIEKSWHTNIQNTCQHIQEKQSQETQNQPEWKNYSYYITEALNT